jgi:hypothetical protein
MDYQKLKNSLIKAREASIEAGKGEDGGTANRDCVFLRLPRAREEKVLATIKGAGLYCRCKSRWIGNGYMIHPAGSGQGNSRARAVEVMKKVLEDDGWDVLGYYQMD